MDWNSRKVLSWRTSNTMTVDFCVLAPNESLALYLTPEIFNSDQGSQFTSEVFTSILIDAEIAILMDGVGRSIDNVFIERLWRTLKYENIYLSPSGSGTELREGIAKYLDFYNTERPHDGEDGLTPYVAYYQSDTRQQVA